MSKETDRQLLIFLGVILALVALSFFLGYQKCKQKYTRDIHEIESQISSLEHQRDSLVFLVTSLDESIDSLQDSLSNQKEKIVYIKVMSYEKADSIRNLPVDAAVEFLARELSKEASSER